ncbi:hypothetical protein [Altererythrobacter lutimaris]|uniref:Uncharacterized protein n=1 Tax=Altererythrobacter lutimaris TaxID=2743979 RepID=A0A850HAM0_9SPHN|nr:hypothetical protein [Altererythrobacter lutimaris]NVE94295.1 hypothetical protein [Altererythrobacter lutimaris]
MRKFLLATAAFGLTLTAAPAIADDHEKAERKLAEVTWYRISMIKWKHGKGDRAHEIIDMYEKVDAALGSDDVIDLHMNTGEWNSIVAFKMKDGIQSMAYQPTGEPDPWDVEFAKQVGGEEKAKEIHAEFQSLIAVEERHIGHIDHPPKAE